MTDMSRSALLYRRGANLKGIRHGGAVLAMSFMLVSCATVADNLPPAPACLQLSTARFAIFRRIGYSAATFSTSSCIKRQS